MKYLHPVSILIEIGVLVRKNEFKNVYFLALSKNVSPLANDNEQGPSGEPLRKTDKFFIERKDDILPSCEQSFNCFTAF